MSRYDGRPFLRLLDCYVLDAIGHLDDLQRGALEAMEPNLASTFGVDGSWTEIVADQMEFPDSFPAQVRAIWQKNVSLAQDHGTAIDPYEFVLAFVNDNFPDAVV
ncbi:hypothetical protein [Arenimonas oryziterrae]|uniref:Uncharacterized protein n=1 Tax=Arenimonas oryziterrae DSM 21050 = YC6267 TaxID=1121015 RepID=A0A091ANR1_9GAMM|nr:hypothetical protein [Arenimonas oryziterrae]KFN40986.1 hypothetical protein N789_03650 [Arenimonas oryziterrae DSM 21050 = YC6267]